MRYLSVIKKFFVSIARIFKEMASKNKKLLTYQQIWLLLHYEWKQRTHALEAARKINEAYGAKTVEEFRVYRWFEEFAKEGMQLSDKERSWPEAVVQAIEANPNMTRMLAEDFRCDQKTIVGILHEAGFKWRKTRLVPHELTNFQKKQRVNRALRCWIVVITIGDMWILYKNLCPNKEWLRMSQRALETPWE
jgi:transposase